MDSIIYLLFFISFAITLIAQILVSARYSKYSKILNSKGLTGFDVAKKILEKNGLGDIYVVFYLVRLCCQIYLICCHELFRLMILGVWLLEFLTSFVHKDKGSLDFLFLSLDYPFFFI